MATIRLARLFELVKLEHHCIRFMTDHLQEVRNENRGGDVRATRGMFVGDRTRRFREVGHGRCSERRESTRDGLGADY